MKRIAFSALLFSALSNYAVANEIELRVLVGATNAKTSNINGLHLPENATPPAIPATVSMADSTSKTSPVVGIDANYYFNENWGVNAGLSYKKHTTNNTYVTINAGGQSWSSSFPSFSITGYELSVGPLYRWKNLGDSGKLSPFAGLNLVGFYGSQDNTNYTLAGVTLNPAGTPKYIMGAAYGVGGPSTHVTCYGYMPRLGFSYELDKKMNIGAEYRYASMSCNNGAMRSLESGYKTDLTTNSVMFTIGYKIQ